MDYYQKNILSSYLREHLGKTQFHDQYHVCSQDHPSTKGPVQEYREYALTIAVSGGKKKKKKTKNKLFYPNHQLANINGSD